MGRSSGISESRQVEIAKWRSRLKRRWQLRRSLEGVSQFGRLRVLDVVVRAHVNGSRVAHALRLEVEVPTTTHTNLT